MAYVTLSGLRVGVPGMVREWCMRAAHTYSIAKSLVSAMVWGGRRGGGLRAWIERERERERGEVGYLEVCCGVSTWWYKVE